MPEPASISRLVPGFDFLESLMQKAGTALPNIGQWIAPTLNLEELEKRIKELRTVQFWLEQNARMLGATIQALEVQKMTLSTLKTMNVRMDDLREGLKVRAGGVPDSRAGAPDSDAGATSAKSRSARPAAAKTPAAAVSTPAAGIDPMQWWDALTKQFAELANAAVKESASDAATHLAGLVSKPAPGAAGRGLNQAVGSARAAASKVARRRRKPNATS